MRYVAPPDPVDLVDNPVYIHRLADEGWLTHFRHEYLATLKQTESAHETHGRIRRRLCRCVQQAELLRRVIGQIDAERESDTRHRRKPRVPLSPALSDSPDLRLLCED